LYKCLPHGTIHFSGPIADNPDAAEILELLTEKDRTAGEIAQQFRSRSVGGTTSACSKAADLVATEREGQFHPLPAQYDRFFQEVVRYFMTRFGGKEQSMRSRLVWSCDCGGGRGCLLLGSAAAADRRDALEWCGAWRTVFQPSRGRVDQPVRQSS